MMFLLQATNAGTCCSLPDGLVAECDSSRLRTACRNHAQNSRFSDLGFASMTGKQNAINNNAKGRWIRR
jgi:hypothetical protein